MSSNGIAEGKHGDHRSLAYYLRSLHREIGYFVLGLTVVYALSGILLVYRETDFLKSPVGVAMVLPPQMSPDEVGKKLRLRQFEVTKTEGGAIYFQGGNALKDGVYDRATGTVSYTEKRFPPFVERLINLHKLSSSKASHLISVVYGVALLFLSLSSFWMFGRSASRLRRGLVLSGGGAVFTVATLFLA